MSQITLFIISIAFPLIVGGISGAITAKEINGWYRSANKPSINPPNFVFGPVWTLLYILMGVSLFIVLKTENTAPRSLAISFFVIQLTLNFFWSILFFTFKKPLWAFAEIIILWISILAMLVLFYKIKPIAGLLQIPYLCWVSFATILTGAFWRLNP